MKDPREIDGWFSEEDFKAYEFLASKVPDGGTFVECGAWLGRSSAFICDLLKGRALVRIVDHWKGSESEREHAHKLASEANLFHLFKENMGDRDFVPIINDSETAAKMYFGYNSCDVVFIDMEHTLEAVTRDIKIWLPKVKVGGYIAGHDYNEVWPGVVKAVQRKFHGRILVIGNCWIVQKMETD